MSSPSTSSRHGAIQPAVPTEHNQIVHSPLQCVCPPPPAPSPGLVLPGQPFTARREETQLLPWLCNGHQCIYNGSQKRWLCLDCANPIRTAHRFERSARIGEKELVCQTLWFAPCMAQLQVPITQLWVHTSLPATLGAPFSTFPSPCMAGQEHRHQLRNGGAEPLAGLGPRWLCGAHLSSAGTHGVCFEHPQGQESIYRGRIFIGQETSGC